MCRRNKVLAGWMLLAFGAGILLGIPIESCFFKCCIGIGSVGLSVMLLMKSGA